MSLLWRNRELGDSPTNVVPPRPRSAGTVPVGPDSALRMSAVWAALRLRADLVSSMPVKVGRLLPGGVEVDVPASTPFLKDPAGDGSGLAAWLYATQVDLDRMGNCYGLIKARDALGKPAVVELLPATKVSVTVRGTQQILSYKVGGTSYDPADIWHERQYVLPGIALGLSPVGYAAWSIGNYLSAQEFALQWFAGGGVPISHLKNTAKTLQSKEADVAKRRFKASQETRDTFVTGSDWEFKNISVAANESQFLETMAHGVGDIARFFGVPGDMLDATTTKGTITYANITQRNLQLLTLHLGPILGRRERALSGTLPEPRFARFDTDTLLRMDPAAMVSAIQTEINSRTLAPSEARKMRNRAPFTPEQLAEFDTLFGSSTPAVVPAAEPPGEAPQ